MGDLQLVMMGSGEERYANFLRRAEAENKGKVCGYVGIVCVCVCVCVRERESESESERERQ
jgi:hypothetical protein